MELPKTYLESSVISYLAARPSRDIVATAHQQLTREWWDRRRSKFDLYVSVQKAISRLTRGMGFEPPIMVTPEELMEG